MNNLPLQKYTQGETILLEAPVVLDQAAYDLTGCFFWFTLRGEMDTVCTDPFDTDALIRKSSSDGIIVTDVAGGIAQILLESEDTKDLPVNIPLYASVRMKTATGQINEIAGGYIIFEPAAALRSYL